MTPDLEPAPGPARFTTGPLRWRAAVPSHRGPGPSRFAGVAAALAVLVAVVALGGAISGTELSADQRFREFVRTGAVGEPVSARTVDLTVLEVRAAAELSGQPGGPAAHDTDGVWVLVRVRAVARQEPVALRYAAVRGPDGQLWLASARLDQPLVEGPYRLEPGIPVEAEIAFEVPRPAATGLTVRLSTDGPDLQMATVAEVRLPLDAAAVEAGLAAEPAALAAEPEVVIADPPVLIGAGGGGR